MELLICAKHLDNDAKLFDTCTKTLNFEIDLDFSDLNFSGYTMLKYLKLIAHQHNGPGYTLNNLLYIYTGCSARLKGSAYLMYIRLYGSYGYGSLKYVIFFIDFINNKQLSVNPKYITYLYSEHIKSYKPYENLMYIELGLYSTAIVLNKYLQFVYISSKHMYILELNILYLSCVVRKHKINALYIISPYNRCIPCIIDTDLKYISIYYDYTRINGTKYVNN